MKGWFAVQATNLIVTVVPQDLRQLRRRRRDLDPLPGLRFAMLGYDLMALEIHRMSVIRERRRKLRRMGFGGLPRGTWPSQPSFPLPGHVPETAFPDIVAGSRTASCITNARHRRCHRLAIAEDQPR